MQRKITKTEEKLTDMLQAQTYSNVLDMAFMLPIVDQKRLIKDMQAHVDLIPVEEELPQYTWEELRAEICEAEEQIARGEVYSNEEDDHMFDEFLKNELGVAV